MFAQHRRRSGPVMVQGPDGKMMPKKAADEAWAIRNEEARELGRIRVAERRTNAQARVADTNREQAQKDRAVKISRIAARWAKVSSRLLAFAQRLRNDLPLLFTLVTVIVSLTVTLSAQWMFYDTLPWPPLFGWLVLPLALLVESGSWTYGIQAQWLAAQGQPYGAQTRRMWLLALLATGMNSYHGAVAFPGHWEMGLILGGGSLLGPAAWHGYVQLTKQREQSRRGISSAARAAIGRRLHHPILAWRAHDLRTATGNRITTEHAFLLVWLQRYGQPPWASRSTPTPRAAVLVRVAWLAGVLAVGLAGLGPIVDLGAVNRVSLVGGALAVVCVAVILFAPGRREPREVGLTAVRVRWNGARFVPAPSADTGASSADTSAEMTTPLIVSSADNKPSSPPARALVGGDGSADDATLTGLDIAAEIKRMELMLAGVEATAPSAETPAETSAEMAQTSSSEAISAHPVERSDSAETGASNAGSSAGLGAGTDARSGAEKHPRAMGSQRSNGAENGPVGKRQRQVRKGDRRPLVQDIVDQLQADGVPLEEITGAVVAAKLEVDIPQSTVRNLVAQIKAEMPSSDQHHTT